MAVIDKEHQIYFVFQVSDTTLSQRNVESSVMDIQNAEFPCLGWVAAIACWGSIFRSGVKTAAKPAEMETLILPSGGNSQPGTGGDDLGEGIVVGDGERMQRDSIRKVT